MSGYLLTTFTQLKVNMKKIFDAYKDTIILLGSVLLGGIIGATNPQIAKGLKPIGDGFLNLVFPLLVPLVFFGITSAIIKTGGEKTRVRKVLSSVVIVFAGTSIITSIISLFPALGFDLAKGLDLSSFQSVIESAGSTELAESNGLLSQIVNTLTVSDFDQLLTRGNMLQLIVMSVLVSIAIIPHREKVGTVINFIEEANTIVLSLIGMVMKLAPIGLGCYFANIIAELGPQLLTVYLKAFVTYTLTCIVYFVVFYSLIAYISGGTIGVKRMWKSIVSPLVTSMATCSSVACIPANLQAVKEIGVPTDIAETTVPLGANLQKHGSVISSVFKILLLLGLYRPEDLTNPGVLIAVVFVAILGGIVMGAIPGGGMLTETLIVTTFGFGIEALPIIVVYGTIIDMPATVLNVTGDAVSSMLVARMVEGKEWIKENVAKTTKPLKGNLRKEKMVLNK